ncbi:class I SAM-dependent methyltransferase [Oricola cellulosilytica]|uniref:Class I SAM-dependent methyltransferase n=1 Tax=Oricola cellulosilytica TaxID=1429082 RepID=A0A4R0PHQ3_9HYPH|nr:class I SAM-dependent methyltransferase [Oricola cellulosilytica]TCD16353.1 class I SAM-dependent methyltransferase [Oricola cellulosilytica]
MSSSVKTLFLPFESGARGWPSGTERVAFLNAQLPDVADDMRRSLDCEQGHRAGFLHLQRAGFAVKPELPDLDVCAGCLVLAGKHRAENQMMIARAGRMVRPGGFVAVAGDKNLGIASLRKWAASRVEIAGSLAKHHATVFWFTVGSGAPFSDIAEATETVDDRFQTAPGMFSSGKVDPGSALLASHFDKRISGQVADFGCGWGFLSARLLEAAKPERLALYEAHWPSLRAAERNLEAFSRDVAIEANWFDLSSEPVARQFDWIVMNPPFHSGRASEPDLGKAFIAAASRALKPNGRLLMVANRKLPYEQALAQGFRRVVPIVEADGFKVVEAVR